MTIIAFLLAAILGYLWGAIPFGKLYVRAFTGQDLQKIGSGRTGGTNSMRAAGWKVGFLTAMSDVFKGFMAVITVRWLLGGLGLAAAELLPWLEITAGTLSVIGHNWSVFLQWGGGAGTGPNVGWSSAIWGPMFPLGFSIMILMLYFLGYASVASMTMGLIIPIAFLVLSLTGTGALSATIAYIVGGIATALIIAFALRGNFVRLARGEERLVGLRAKKRASKEQRMEISKERRGS